MNKYHKIQSIFKRDPETHRFDERYSMPEFEYLRDLSWTFTETLEGMNTRVGFDPVDGLMRIGGRSDKAEIPGRLMDRMNEIFIPDRLAAVCDGSPLTIYGEGIGSKIQRGAGYLPPSSTGTVDFILFDVQFGEHWADRETVSAIAHSFGCREAPLIDAGVLLDAVSIARRGFPSKLEGADKDKRAEGLVIRPTQELRGRWGQRIIAKVKTKDFE